MTEEKIFILNSPILTDWGSYVFRSISLEEAKNLLKSGFISAIGHEATAQVMTELLGVTIPTNRTAIKMAIGDKALIFRLLIRLPEGKVLSKEELSKIPYELGLLIKVR